MALFGRRVADTEYGVRVTRVGWPRVKEHWYGSDRDKRDRKHNEYVGEPDVLVVQDIQRAK